MRIRNVPLKAFGPYARYRGFGAFGTPSQYQDKECPVGGSFEAWCDCVFPRGSDLHTRCHSRPIPAGFFAPWTEVGAAGRGLPKPGSIVASATATVLQIVSPLTGGIVQAPVTAPLVPSVPPVQSVPVVTTQPSITVEPTAGPAEASIFGIPKTIAGVGAVVLAVGVAALAFGGKR